jgi:Mg-chelatase subunit ChlD
VPSQKSADSRARALRPLTRRPKLLTEAPELFEAASSSSSGTPWRAVGRNNGPIGNHGRDDRDNVAWTEEDGGFAETGRDTDAPRVEAMARAQEIAARLSFSPPRLRAEKPRGHRRLESVPFTGSSSDIDLDRTLEAIVEKPRLDEKDVYVRERVAARESIVACIDVSGSMRGDRVVTMAATVGALASHLRDEKLGIIAFWSDAAQLVPLGESVHASRIVDLLMSVPAKGLTNVSWPLELAARHLRSDDARVKRIILLSDCVHNAGPDPRLAAVQAPRIDVLLDVSGNHDRELGAEIARAGRGSMYAIKTYLDVVPALEGVLG